MAIPNTQAARAALAAAQRELLQHRKHFEQQAQELQRYLDQLVSGETDLAGKADAVQYAMHHLSCGNTARRLDLLAKAMCDLRLAAAQPQE
jgi:uncharacterized protein (DUF3084 family)